jgi:tyrosinase
MESLNLPPSKLDRRIFIKGMGWITVGVLAGFTLGGCEGCQDAIKNRPVRRRLRSGSPEVDAAINTYRQAVKLMKDRSAANASDVRGWSAQAAIHGTKNVGFNFCQHGTNHFFSWHRAYLVWFERICQELTGDKKFGLPYWNWNQDPAIHPAFLDNSSVLFMPRNNTSMAGQTQVASNTLDLIFSDTNFFTFSQQLEGTPHNRVHTYTGGDFGGFGSAMDPIFWMHHCMIDYCWAKWNLEMNNDNTNDSTWLNTNWTHFYDASGNPTQTNAVATTLMPILSYRYESSAIGSNGATISPDKAELKKIEARIRKGADIRFDVKQRISLADTAQVSMMSPFTARTNAAVSEFSRIINNDKSKETVFASIEYATLPPTSDFFVRVFINLPQANVNTPTTDNHYAGSFSFFGTDGGMMHGDHANHIPRFLVNITPTIEKLRNSGELKDNSEINLSLVAIPDKGQFEKPDASLRLSNIDLIVTPVIIRSAQN